jgi:hypothetical protein
MRVARWAVLAGLMVVLLPGCGEESGSETLEKRPVDPQKVGLLAVTLAGSVGPESAGIMMAEHRGYFADEGLDVEILAPGSPLSPVRYVVEEEDDFGLSHQPEVMLAKEQGAPITAFGSLIPRPTAAMIWLKRSKIRGIEDLKGKTIAIPGLPFQEDLLEVVLARAGLTLEDVRTRSSVARRISRASSSKRPGWTRSSRQSAALASLPMKGWCGLPAPISQPRIQKCFATSSQRFAAEIEDPRTAARVIDTDWESVWGTGREEMEAEVEATLPLLSETGYMSPAWARNLASWMRDEGLIPGREGEAG